MTGGKLKKSLRQRRNYAARRVCCAIERLLAATSKEEKEQATKWVIVWKKQLAKL
ncbi:hypothetical protein [Rhodoferax sp.]|uniref:hypothetical protein n=1 Tax=Rhodoferax sp. TaxID=50421 RepID=UPI00261A37AA|nr:hypothetical protein [Rhodoferax sp.]MDD3935967.1 hypothetical protein [Rhodoferax sp.]